LHEPVFSYFPEYADLKTPEKAQINLRHLLTMSAGLALNDYIRYSDPANSERHMVIAPDRHQACDLPEQRDHPAENVRIPNRRIRERSTL
jgi:CubicO group peptidase (beta-lactamase class C family)